MSNNVDPNYVQVAAKQSDLGSHDLFHVKVYRPMFEKYASGNMF